MLRDDAFQRQLFIGDLGLADYFFFFIVFNVVRFFGWVEGNFFFFINKFMDFS